MSVPRYARLRRNTRRLGGLLMGLTLGAALTLAAPGPAQAQSGRGGYVAPSPQDAPWATPARPATPAASTPAEAFRGARGQAAQAPAAPAPAAPPAAPAASVALAGSDLLDRGEFAAASGRFDEAERLWRQALAQRPDWTTVKQRLAELPSRRVSFRPELEQQERRRQARLAMVQGVTDFNARRYGEARRNFQHFLEVFPDDAEALYYLDLAKAQGGGVGPGRLKVVCSPEAQVYLDGRPVGRTPLILPAPPGSHRVEVRAHGGAQSREVTMPAGGEAGVSFTLLGGFLAVNARPWAEVVLDGKPVGNTPLTLENLVLGPHQVKARRPGYPEQVQEVTLTAGQTAKAQFILEGR